MATDRDALACDLAETYNIYDMEALPVETLAVFCAGLRDDSRIRMKMAGQVLTPEQIVSISMLDRLNMLIWMQTEDAKKKRNRPKSMLEAIINKDKKTVDAFRSGKDFEAARMEIIKNG